MSTLLPIRIVDHEIEVDLRTINHNIKNLERIAKEYNLTKHCEAVVFSNKAYDRWRLVAIFYGIPVLVLPPIDPSAKLSLYLTISQFLRKFSARKSVTDHLDREIIEAKERISDQERRVMARQIRRASNG